MNDKIKNEIIPLLNGDETDELDDEVAMISNKNINQISTDDIKVELD